MLQNLTLHDSKTDCQNDILYEKPITYSMFDRQRETFILSDYEKWITVSEVILKILFI